MQVSELIQKLTEVVEQRGDMPVCINYDSYEVDFKIKVGNRRDFHKVTSAVASSPMVILVPR